MVIDMVRLLYGVGIRTLTYTVCLDSWARNSRRHGTCGNRSIILFFNARRYDATQTLRKMVIDMVRFLYSGGIEPEHLSNARSSGRPYAERSYTWYVFCIAWGFEPEHFINARSSGRRYEKWSYTWYGTFFLRRGDRTLTYVYARLEKEQYLTWDSWESKVAYATTNALGYFLLWILFTFYKNLMLKENFSWFNFYSYHKCTAYKCTAIGGETKRQSLMVSNEINVDLYSVYTVYVQWNL